jgi:dTDP-glucose pyrophosphorylase
MTVKAILVAGGHGSRLAPFTHYLQKTLLPLYDRPVIDYALATIRRAGITDITVVANRFVGQISDHVGQGLGIYLFDETFWNRFDRAVETTGDEFSITDVTRTYVIEGQAEVVSVGADTWMDCGTPESLLQASIMAKEGKLNLEPRG